MIFLKVLVLVSYLAMISINFLANSKPINGISTGDVSKKYSTLFTPKGFTFSIWGIIYILLFLFVIKFIISEAESIENIYEISIIFIISCFLNITWLFCWHFDKIALSTIVMIALLTSLLLILHFLPKSGFNFAALSIYAGWISVALIANISILIFKYDISFFMNNQWLWFYLVIGFSLVICLYMVFVKKNYYYGLVFLWAYFGITMKFVT